MRRLLLLALVVMLAPACGGGNGAAPAASATSAPAAWDERDPIIYSVVVAEVLDDLGAVPPAVYVVDSICADAGQVRPSELECSAGIPQAGRDAIVEQLTRYASVGFVDAPTDVASAGGPIRDDGLLFWFGPVTQRKNGEVRVGANYTRELTDERSGAVNLALENQAGSWVVTGAAGLGGCPA